MQKDSQSISSDVKKIQIKGMIDDFGISRREGEVLSLLTDGTTTISGIGETLGLSPNTVSNHLKSLLAKTATKNKAELVALALGRSIERLAALETYCRRPTALLIEQQEGTLREAQLALTHQGFLVTRVCRDHRREFLPCFDLVVLDDDGDAKNFLERYFDGDEFPADATVSCIVLSRNFSENFSPPQIGAYVEYLPFESDLKRLLFQSVFLVTDDAEKRNRLQRVNTMLETIIGGESAVISNIGFGGAFVAVSTEQQNQQTKPFRLGRQLDISIKLGETQLKGKAKIAWIQKKSNSQTEAGVGITFLKLEGSARQLLKRFVQSTRDIPVYPN